MCACFACNNARGTTTVSQWLRVCERNGLTPHRNAIINALTRLAAEHGPAAALAASELADLTSARTWQQRHHQRGHTRKRVRVRTRTRQQSSDTAYELAYALYPSS